MQTPTSYPFLSSPAPLPTPSPLLSSSGGALFPFPQQHQASAQSSALLQQQVPSLASSPLSPDLSGGPSALAPYPSYASPTKAPAFQHMNFSSQQSAALSGLLQQHQQQQQQQQHQQQQHAQQQQHGTSHQQQQQQLALQYQSHMQQQQQQQQSAASQHAQAAVQYGSSFLQNGAPGLGGSYLGQQQQQQAQQSGPYSSFSLSSLASSPLLSSNSGGQSSLSPSSSYFQNTLYAQQQHGGGQHAQQQSAHGGLSQHSPNPPTFSDDGHPSLLQQQQTGGSSSFYTRSPSPHKTAGLVGAGGPFSANVPLGLQSSSLLMQQPPMFPFPSSVGPLQLSLPYQFGGSQQQPPMPYSALSTPAPSLLSNRWHCPGGCGKALNKRSFRSLKKHKTNCVLYQEYVKKTGGGSKQQQAAAAKKAQEAKAKEEALKKEKKDDPLGGAAAASSATSGKAALLPDEKASSGKREASIAHSPQKKARLDGPTETAAVHVPRELATSTSAASSSSPSPQSHSTPQSPAQSPLLYDGVSPAFAAASPASSTSSGSSSSPASVAGVPASLHAMSAGGRAALSPALPQLLSPRAALRPCPCGLGAVPAAGDAFAAAFAPCSSLRTSPSLAFARLVARCCTSLLLSLLCGALCAPPPMGAAVPESSALSLLQCSSRRPAELFVPRVYVTECGYDRLSGIG